MGVISMTKVIRSSREISGIDDPIGSEWDAGYIPDAPSHRRCRVTVRKDASDKFSVYCVASKGDIKLASWDIKTFPCETCAKAFSLCLVFGDDYAACRVHDRQEFSGRHLFDGSLIILLSLMGVSRSEAGGFDDYVWHRLGEVVYLIRNERVPWSYVIRAWEATEQIGAQEGWSLPSMVGWWFGEIGRQFYNRIEW
jgi:hypothetical protein